MIPNLFSVNIFPVDNEITEQILNTPNCRIERIISGGQSTPEGFWYDQDEDEWVCLLAGKAIIEFQDSSPVTLDKGDYYFIPAHLKHRVSYTSTDPVCIWLAVFSKP